MNIIFNPLSNNALTENQLKNNDDIIFDLRGNNIFAKGVKFYGTDTHVEVLDVLDSERTDAALSANMGRNLDLNKVPYNNQTKETNPPSQFGTIICPTNKSRQEDVPTDNGLLFRTNTGSIADLWISSDDNYIYKRQNTGIWQKIGAGYADSIDWSNITNAPNTLPNPKSLIIFDVSYNGSEQVTITPNNYIYKVAKANINTNPITDKMAFIGTYYEPSDYIESVSNTPLRYSVSDMWDNWLKPKIENWYKTQGSKVDAVLWGSKFTGTEDISNSLYLEDGSQIFVNDTEILDYQSNVLYVGYGTRLENNSTYIYGGNNITLYTQGNNQFKVTTSDISINLPVYAKNTMNVTNGLYLSSHIIGKLDNTTQSYTDPWLGSNADFRFGGSLAATKIYASQGFYHPNYDSTTGEIYLLTADGDTTTVKYIRSAVFVRQNNSNNNTYPLIWADEANTESKYNTYLYKSYDKLTFNPSTISLTIGSSNNPTSSMWIDGMVKAAVNTYSNGYRAWISGSTSSGRLSIGSFGNSASAGTDGNIYFSYASTANINTNTNDVISDIWINPKNSLINSTHFSGYDYTATGGYHLQRNGSDVTFAVPSTDGDYWNLALGDWANNPWGCIPIVSKASGVMEVGKYIDFHNDNSGYDFTTRLQTDGNYSNTVLMPKKNGRLLVESDLDNIKSMYEVVINLHPSNYVLDSNNKYVWGGFYDENTWYPIEIQLVSVGKCSYPVIRGEILQYLACGYTDSSGTRIVTGSGNCRWMTDQNGFSTRIVFESQASGWGTAPNNILRIMDANQTWCVVNPVRNMVQDYKSSSIIVWCRGYGEYRFRFNYPNVNVIVHNSSFSLGDPGNSNIYKTYSFNSIINNTDDPSWNDIWKDLNSKLPEIKPTLGYWANVAVSNISSKDTSPTFYTVWAQDMFRSIGQTGWYNETFQDGIVMKESKWIETWAGANIYTSGAMSASKLLVGFGKSTDTNYDLDISNTNGSRFKGTINLASTNQNYLGVPAINFRYGSGSDYDTWCVQQTYSNEALVFGSNEADTAFMWYNGIKYTSITNSQYYNLSAPLVIRNNKVFMGNTFSSTSSSSYTLNVTNGIGTDLINADTKITSKAFYLQDYTNYNYLITTNGGYMKVITGTTSYSRGMQIGNMVWLYINYNNFENKSYYVIPSNISTPTSEVRVLGFGAGRGNWDKYRVGTFKITAGSRYLNYVEGDTNVCIYQTICYTI